MLRYLEWWGQAQVGLDGPPVVEALGPSYGDFTRKLVGDIARTCVTAANLGDGWLDLATGAGNGGALAATRREQAEAPTDEPQTKAISQLKLS